MGAVEGTGAVVRAMGHTKRYMEAMGGTGDAEAVGAAGTGGFGICRVPSGQVPVHVSPRPRLMFNTPTKTQLGTGCLFPGVPLGASDTSGDLRLAAARDSHT